MLSLLLIAQNQKTIQEYIDSFSQKEQIHTLDITSFANLGSIGIEDIRNLQAKFYLKPIKSKQKLMILWHADTATIEAQNALLKVLEEPPADTQIILTAINEDALLPTILSRCTVIHLKEEVFPLSEEKRNQYTSILVNVASKSIGEKLKLAQDISKTKEDALLWLKEAIHALREIVLQQPTIPQVFLLKKLQQAHQRIATTNISARMIMEDVLLEFLI